MKVVETRLNSGLVGLLWERERERERERQTDRQSFLEASLLSRPVATQGTESKGWATRTKGDFLMLVWDLRQMSIPSPLESHIIPASWGVRGLHSCTLGGCCKSIFLHSKEKIQSLIDLPQGWWAKCSQDCCPCPNKGANQISSPEKAHESMANEKTHLT
jgi:hypothetical protein